MRLQKLTIIGLIMIMWVSTSVASRQLHSLEKFDVSDLSVVLISSKRSDGSRFAYIKDPNGYVHHLEVGEYIGKYNGRVMKISESEVCFVEIRSRNGINEEVERVLRLNTKR